MILVDGMVTVEPATLLAVRDALVAGNAEEAYHQLRMAADANGHAHLAFGNHWHDWEYAAKKRHAQPGTL